MSRDREKSRDSHRSSERSWSRSRSSRSSSGHRHHHHDHHSHSHNNNHQHHRHHPPSSHQQSYSSSSAPQQPPSLVNPPPIQPFDQMMMPMPQQIFSNPPMQTTLSPGFVPGNFINMNQHNQQTTNAGFLGVQATNLPQNISLPPEIMSSLALSRLQLPAHQITETGIIPNIAYYELPAGLMVPLVPLSRNTPQPIDPSQLRLPLPKFPDENFLKTIDSYYQTADARLRDSDGWDQNFLATYRSQKEAASIQALNQ